MILWTICPRWGFTAPQTGPSGCMADLAAACVSTGGLAVRRSIHPFLSFFDAGLPRHRALRDAVCREVPPIPYAGRASGKMPECLGPDTRLSGHPVLLHHVSPICVFAYPAALLSRVKVVLFRPNLFPSPRRRSSHLSIRDSSRQTTGAASASCSRLPHPAQQVRLPGPKGLLRSGALD